MPAAPARIAHFSSLRLPLRPAMLAILAGLVLSGVCIALTSQNTWGAGMLLSFALAWMSAVDMDRFVLPDIITLGLILAGLALHLVQGSPSAQLDSAIGAVAGYGGLAVVSHAYRRLRGRDGLGLGDAKLLAAAGAWLGWAALPIVLLGASATGLLWAAGGLIARGRGGMAGALPFGPFISLAFFTAWLFVS